MRSPAAGYQSGWNPKRLALYVSLIVLWPLSVAAVCWFLEAWELGALLPLAGILAAVGGSTLLGRVPPDTVRGLPSFVVATVGVLLPGWASHQKEIEESRQLCERMEGTLSFYRLPPLGPGLKQKVVKELCSWWHGGASSRVVHCARLVSERVHLPEELLVVLYYEQNRPMPSTVWPPGDGGDATLAALAKRLAHHELVRRESGPNLTLGGQELETILRGLVTFHFEDVLAAVRVFRDVWTIISGYWSFLEGNFSGLREPPTPAGALEKMAEAARRPVGPETLEDIDRALPVVLARVGEESLGAWLGVRSAVNEGAAASSARAVTLLSLATFFSRPGDFPGEDHLATVCHALAELPGGDPGKPWRSEGVRLVWAYLVAKQEHRNGLWGEHERYLRLDLFLDRRPEVLERRREDDVELETLYHLLIERQWPVSREDLMEAARRRPEPSAPPHPPPASEPSPTLLRRRPMADVVDRVPASAGALRSLFSHLDLDTVERLTETKRVRPYLLTIGSSKQPIPALLDCLASERKGPELAAAGIKLFTDKGERKYNFVHYTPFSRLGFVPSGVAFVDFCKRLEEDLATSLRARARLLPPSQLKEGPSPKKKVSASYEVLVHVFRPVVGNPFGFGEGERGAMLRLKRVLAEHLDRQELAQLPDYGKRFEPTTSESLVTALMRDPIAEVRGVADLLGPAELAAIRKVDAAVKDEFRLGLEIGLYDDEKLQRQIRSGSEGRATAVESLSKAIHRHVPRLAGDKVDKVAEAYLQELEALMNTLVELETTLGRGLLVSS